MLLLDGKPLLTGRFAPLGLANGSWPLRAGFATTPVTALAVGFEPPSMSCIKKTRVWSGTEPLVVDPTPVAVAAGKGPEPAAGKGPEVATGKGAEPVVGREPGPVVGKGPELATGKELEPVVGRGPGPVNVVKGPEPAVGNGPGLVVGIGTNPRSSSSSRRRAAETKVMTRAKTRRKSILQPVIDKEKYQRLKLVYLNLSLIVSTCGVIVKVDSGWTFINEMEPDC